MRSVTVIEIFIFQGERVRLAGHLSGNWGGRGGVVSRGIWGAGRDILFFTLSFKG